MKLRYLRDVVTLELDQKKCTGCGHCLEVCPRAVFVLDDGSGQSLKVRIADRDACMECGACQQNCAFGALSVRAGVGCANAVILSLISRADSACRCQSSGDSC